MELKTLRWADFALYKPCYDPQEAYGDWSGTILDLLRREDIPAEDRIWAATREGILDDNTLRLLACKCVRQVWHLLTDDRSRNAVEVAERYAMGEATDKELVVACAAAGAVRGAAGTAAMNAAAASAMNAAWAAAGTAAWAAAQDAAWAAAWAAAKGTTWDTAWVAAMNAAMNAAKDTAWVAAGDAARKKQVKILIDLLK